MGKKYIVKLDDNKLAYTAIIIDGVPYIKPLQLLPYTEPDLDAIRKEEYNKGFQAGSANTSVVLTEGTAKKIRQEGYDKGFSDAMYNCHESCAFLDDAKKEAYQRGYDDAKHECQDCQKIMTDAEQERVDKAYQQGLEDARNREATCEFCEHAGNDESDEPCVRCCCGYMNRFRPKREPKKIEFGDELRSKNTPDIRICVTNVRESKWDGIAISEVIDRCRFGSSYTDRNLDGWEKTGRNFASALQDMMNEKN